MSEVFFYHLTESRLEEALPGLLERSLERGWRVVVQTTGDARRDALDEHLWTFRDDAFLPHGAEGAASEAGNHPIWITTADDNPNTATIRFLVDGAEITDLVGYERVITMFDGHDDDAVTQARAYWKALKADDHDLTYWQQGEGGRWQKKG